MSGKCHGFLENCQGFMEMSRPYGERTPKGRRQNELRKKGMSRGGGRSASLIRTRREWARMVPPEPERAQPASTHALSRRAHDQRGGTRQPRAPSTEQLDEAWQHEQHQHGRRNGANCTDPFVLTR